MKIEQGKNYLVTLTDWVCAHDGRQYRAVWGPCETSLAKDVLNITPARSANWFLRVGTGSTELMIAGCRVHYVQECPTPPKTSRANATDKQLSASRRFFCLQLQ